MLKSHKVFLLHHHRLQPPLFGLLFLLLPLRVLFNHLFHIHLIQIYPCRYDIYCVFLFIFCFVSVMQGWMTPPSSPASVPGSPSIPWSVSGLPQLPFGNYPVVCFFFPSPFLCIFLFMWFDFFPDGLLFGLGYPPPFFSTWCFSGLWESTFATHVYAVSDVDKSV